MSIVQRIIAAYIVLSANALVARADPVADCGQSRILDARMRGCSEIIKGTDYTAEQKARAFRNRGLARADAGAHEQALADLSEAIRLNSGDSAAYAGRAQVRLSKGETDAAIADFTAALSLAPQSGDVLIGRGHAYLVKGLADPAIADFTETIRLYPKSSTAFNHRGLALRRKGDLQRAIDDYTSAVTLNPIYALAYNNRGYAYEANGQRDEAIADFNRALQLDRSLVGASAGLKRLKAVGSVPDDNDRLIREGRALVDANCARCHAVGTSGTSPNPKAPEFRNLQQRHPVLALREPLTRGIAAPHDEMPKFALPDGEVDKIITYINSLPTSPRR
jgi:tetratricopeptide (TPR) repeat protein